jgi:hypothetical protein
MIAKGIVAIAVIQHASFDGDCSRLVLTLPLRWRIIVVAIR